MVETDLGEYIVQLRGERPSHIIAPVIHLTKETIELDFRRKHERLPRERRLDRAEYLVAEARAVLREKFLAADVGITGANLLIAETGSSVIVTNEGNGDLTSTLPRMHIVIASIEKIVPTLEDASTILRLLARSATGQEITTYTTFATGPRREGDPDGPTAYHVVLLDNGRSEMLGNEFADMLRCIRCGACLNHCPVYGAIGGHAYGSIYPGPMGAVLTPQLVGIDHARDLPNASSFCGRCEEVCPMDIPLPDMMRAWRERDYARGNPPRFERLMLKLWAFAAKRPRLYHALAGVMTRSLARRAGARGRLSRLPLMQAWTVGARSPRPARQDLPAALRTVETEGPFMSAPEDARSTVMGRIRASLGVASLDRARKASVERRLERHPRGTIPARAKRGRAECVALFTEMLAAQGARCAPHPHAKRGGGGDRVLSRHLQFAAAHPHGPGRRACRAAVARRLGHRALDRTGGANRPGRVVARRRGRGRDRNLVPGVGPRKSDHAELPA